MEKHIRKILMRMSVIVTALVFLGVWQWDFIWHGIEHNIWVNSAIFLTIIAGCVIAFLNVAKLKNEIVAFEALQEMWEDARDGPERAAIDPLWRHYRCVEPGIVFQRPKILGHVYDLVTEEIARTKKFSISIETMQTLIHKIDVKLSEEKSLLSYMAGLLVFMGLIGTFMGLLKMVGSIGGILAGLQTMSGGDNGGDAFGQLLTQLQQPLGGMATGFASSLFGLFGSLVVGLLGRYAHQAASQLKVEFESWLAAVAQIDTHGASGATVAGGMSHADSSKMIKLLTDIAQSTAKAARAMDSAVVLLDRIAEVQGTVATSVTGLERQFDAQATFHDRLLSDLQQFQPVVPSLVELGAEMRGVGERISHRLDHGLRSIGETTSSMAEKLDIRQSELMDELGERQAAMLRSLSAEISRIQAQQQTGPAPDARLTELLTDLHQNLSSRPMTATVDMSRMETVFTEGLQELSRNMEAAFQAFSQVSRLVEREEPAAEDDISDFFQDSFTGGGDGQQPTIAAGAFAEALARRTAQSGK
jgi:hypothetical protein